MAKSAGSAQAVADAEKALRTNRILRFNNLLDAGVAGFLLLLTAAIVLVSARYWYLLLIRQESADLRETHPVWISPVEPSPAVSARIAGILPLAVALMKELSVEASLERAQHNIVVCEGPRCDLETMPAQAQPKINSQLYLEVTERRFRGVNRCC